MSDKKTSKNANEGKGGNRKLLILILIIALLIALITIGVMAFHMINDKPEQSTTVEQGARGVVISSENAEQIAEEMANSKPVEPGYYTVAMTTGWHFANGTSVSSDALVKNKPENSHDVYFDLFLADDRENPIYMSPVISLGAELDQIKLDRDLPKGEYQCVMVYHLVDKDQNTVDTLEVAQQVIIEN